MLKFATGSTVFAGCPDWNTLQTSGVSQLKAQKATPAIF
jgi:hypothetical protein